MEQKENEITKSSRKRRRKKVLKKNKRSANDDTDGLLIMNTKKKQGRYNGVTKINRKKYSASIKIDSKMKYLGIYDTCKDAALAYDRAVIQHKRPSSKLNFPHDDTTSSQDNESREEENEAIGSDDDDDDALAFPRVPHLFKHGPIS